MGLREWDELVRWIRLRPTVEVAIAMVIGSSVAFCIVEPAPYLGPLAMLGGSLLSIIVFFIRNVKAIRLLTWITFMVCGFGLASLNIWTSHSFEPPGKSVIHATVCRLLSSGENFRVLLVSDGFVYPSHTRLHGYGRLVLRNNSEKFSAGDRISFRSSLRKPSNRGNPGEYDWQLDCMNEGIVWLASVRDEGSVVILNRAKPYSPVSIVFSLRNSMLRFIDENSGRYFATDSSHTIKAILKGIILGDRGDISPEINRSFSDSGLVHMFSASGVHVTIVGLMAFFMVKSFFRFRPRWLLRISLPVAGAIAAIPTITLYCVLVGFKAPSMRATIMGLVLACSVLGRKRWDSLNTLALASLMIIMIYPLSFLTPSFQLSFAAVAGIVLMIGSDAHGLLRRNLSSRSQPEPNETFESIMAKATVDFIRKPLISVVVVTVAATIATSPIVAQLFQRIPLYGIPANLVAEFPLSLGLICGLLASVISIFSTQTGAAVLVVSDFCIWMVLRFADFFSSLPMAVIHIPEMGLAGLVASVISTILFFTLLRMPSRKTLMALCVCLAALLAVGLTSRVRANVTDRIFATFLNVGNGDAAFVRPPQTRGILVDGGPKSDFFDAGQSIILPFFMTKSVFGLDAVIVSHSQADHIGGLYTAMKQAPTQTIFMNEIKSYPEQVFRKQALELQKNVSIRRADRSSPIHWIGDAKLTFINSAAPASVKKLSGPDVNNMSVAARLDYHDFSILFLGDLEKQAENDLLTSGINLRATVLKVAHHGGRTSATSETLLQVIKPKIAVVSADYPPKGGIPNMEVIERLKQYCSKVYWTGRDGALTVSSSGSGPTEVFIGKSKIREFVD